MSSSGWQRQLLGLVLLRATLLKNQLFRRGRRLAGAVAVLVLLLLGAFAVAIGVGSFFLGAALARDNVAYVGYAWHGYMVAFLFFWFIGLMADLQRAEALDIRRLLHLPISFDRVFLLNFISSLACPTVALVGSGCAGLALGSASELGASQLLVLLVSGSVALAVAAISYGIQGWLATLMENARTRRTVLTVVPLAFIILSQLPQLGVTWSRHERDEVDLPSVATARTPSEIEERRERAKAARRARDNEREREIGRAFEIATGFLPPLWPGAAATSLSAGSIEPTLLATLASLGIAFLAFLRALRTARRHYVEGYGEASPAKKAPAPTPRTDGARGFLELSIRGVPEDVVAMATASLRMLSREPVFRISLLTLPIFAFVFAGVMRGGASAPPWQHHFLPVMAAFTSVLVVHKFTTNVFGTDRDGFRLLVLLPTPRARLLLGRNLSLLPVTLLVGLAMLGVLALFRGLAPIQWVTGVLELVLVHTLSCTVGNFLSILNPFRVSVDATARNRARPSFLAVLELLLALPLVNFPVALPPLAEVLAEYLGVLPGVPVAPLVALVLVAIAIGAYALSLPAAGEYLARRERDVLETLTRAAGE